MSHTRSRKGNPYIPSYMDLSNGPELCVVCGDAATGYHYRCMTCEGCKGFFRRTIQKGLQYVCKGEQQCSVDKSNRNQCQECRYQKCLEVGMATDLVLDEKQRKAKRQLINENRERRKLENIRSQIINEESGHRMSEEDKNLIHEITKAFADTVDQEMIALPESSQLRDVITPSVIRIISFGKKIPGFSQIPTEDQILLLKGCSVELTFLKIARQFDLSAGLLVLPSGRRFSLADIQLNSNGLGTILGPVYAFGLSLSRLQLSDSEMALVASLMLMNFDKSGLRNRMAVERIQDVILSAFKRYVSETHPGDFVRWAKLLMLAAELRAIGGHQADKVLFARPEHSALVLEMFGYSSISV